MPTSVNKARAFLIDYDEESDTLYLYSAKEKAAGSIDFGDVHLDYAKDGTATGLEFLNATKTIPPLLVISHKDFDAGKAEWLKKITKANISVYTQANFLVISFTLFFQKREVDGKISLPVAAPKQLEKALIRA